MGFVSNFSQVNLCHCQMGNSVKLFFLIYNNWLTHIGDKKNINSGKDPTDGLENTTIKSEVKYSNNISKSRKRIV